MHERKMTANRKRRHRQVRAIQKKNDRRNRMNTVRQKFRGMMAGFHMNGTRILEGIITFCFMFLLLFTILFTSIKPHVTVEAGDKLPTHDELLNSCYDVAHFSGKYKGGSVAKKLETYKVRVRVLFYKRTCTVEVKDTIAPKITAKDVTIYEGENVKETDFVKKAKDQTKISYKFVTIPDVNTIGTYKIKIKAVDEGKNVTEFSAKLDVKRKDTTPPEINGVKDITVNLGQGISYKKGVTVTDDSGEDIKLNVDTSKVDTSTAGTYTVTYSAKDSAGNVAEKTAKVTIVIPEPDVIDETYMDAKADELLKKITTDGMTQREKAKAIWKWCHDNIAYVDNTPKINEWDASYRGIVKRQGDCYTYAMSCKLLLTRAGIQNMDIMTKPGNPRLHYWNLVNFGDGWRHLDATRRFDGSTFFLTPDADLWEYNNTHGHTHEYDPSLYPTIL